MSAPVLPKSAAPNNWLSTAVSGSTLTGTSTTRDQLSANAYNVTLVGGGLDDTYIAYDPSTTITEGASGGVDTVLTWGNAYTLPTNVENLTLMGTANSTATGNAGNNIITTNDGSNKVVTGGGNDVLVSTNGANTFVPTVDDNSVTWIVGFKTSGTALDKIDVSSYGFTSFDNLKTRMTQVGTDVKIDLGNQQSVMIENKTIADFSAANFNIGATNTGTTPSTTTPTTGTTPTNTTSPTTTSTLPLSNLQLTYAEEFNTLDLYNSWKPHDAWGNRTLSGNKELQLYVDPKYKGLGLNPFSVKDGILTITAAKTPAHLVDDLGGFKYTSGMLTSYGNFSQKYGYFEMRAQVTTEMGLWPAFWLLQADKLTWPPELDIMEVVGKDPTRVHQTVHTDAASNSGKATSAGEDLALKYHTFGMDWTKEKITFYFDGKATHSVTTPADHHVPMYILLNLAVGGNWPGSPDGTTDWTKTNYNIDYVRVYKHGTGGSTPTPTTPTEPTPLPEPTPTTPIAGLDAVLSNATNPLDLTSSFKAPVTGNGTSKTYTASQMNVAGVASATTVTVAYDATGGITVTNNGAWNGIKNATVKDTESGKVTINNFVDAEITLGAGNDTVTVDKAKRGNIATGAGDDKITVTAYANSTNDNLMKIDGGAGADTIAFSGAGNTRTAILGGSENDQITLGGQATGTANGGDGDDRLLINSTGATTVTGGLGRDVFEVAKGAKTTVTDFKKGEDSLALTGIALSDVKVQQGTSSTLVDLGNGSTVTLAGVSLSAGDLGLAPLSPPVTQPIPGEPTPLPEPEPLPEIQPALTATLSNAMNSDDMSDTFQAAATGAGTSKTYTGSQMQISGVSSSTSVAVGYDASNALSVSNKSAWNTIKNAIVTSTSSGTLTISNFVDAEIALGDGGNNVTVNSAKRGNIVTGSGNDQITVNGYSNSTNDNLMKINAGAGNDTIRITDSQYNRSSITGGAGNDIFEFIASAHATITDFDSSQDSIVLKGVSSSSVQVKAATGGTLIDLGKGSSVMLSGVSLPASSINIAYA